MKRTTVLCIAYLSALVSMSCSQAATRTVDGGAGALAARAGGAGAAPIVGGSGGAPTGTAGAPSVAAAGSGGAPSSAGASAGGGGSAASAGSAGTLSGIAGAGIGGTGTAGTGPGGAGTAGTAGASGMTSADPVPGLHGFYWEATCAGSIAVRGHDCPMSDANPTCPAGGIDREQTLPVHGVPGQLYTINIEVRGVIGTRCYQAGKRASTAAPNEMGDNIWWYEGGVCANPTGWFNTFELHVSPSTGAASGDVYYFNNADVSGGTYCERDATYLVNYKASFRAMGGGTLTFKIHDHDCRAQQNCGSNTDPSSPCAPRTVNLAGMAEQPPANFTQPPSNTSYKPQWLWIAVSSVTSP